MAVYTKITDKDVEAHLQNYDIGELQSLKGIAEGVQNSNYLLSTTKGQYILTLYEQMVAEKDLPFYIELMRFLSASGINCPQPMATRTGETLMHLCTRPAAIVSFLNGVSVSEPTTHHCHQLGQILAKMHKVTSNTQLYLENALGQDKWRAFYGKSKARVAEISAELPQIMESELGFLEQNWPQDLPPGIIHADLFPDNVFFLGEQLSGLIDFYFAANDLLAFDLAICLNAWCFEKDGSFNLQKSTALIAGYQSVRQLQHNETTALPILCRGASVRFLVTRIYDWLNVPDGAIVVPHDPLIYLERLKFHQKISTAHEYGVEISDRQVR